MIIEQNQDVPADVNDGGEGDAPDESGAIQLSREEYDKLKANEVTLGSLKRELKDLRKSTSEPKEAKGDETPKNQTEEFGLLQKTYLLAAGVKEEDEIELARDVQKKIGIEWDKLVDDDYFKLKLQGLRDTKANAEATDIGKAGRGVPSDVKNTVGYWAQKGELPSEKDISDRAKRAEMIRKLGENQRNQGGMFYNE